MSTTDLISLFLALIAALLGAIGYFVKRILDRTEGVERALKPITPAIVEIQGKFTEAGHNIMLPLTVTPASPLKLTDYGKDLLEKSGFGAALVKHKVNLIKQVRAKNPKTNYDIQKYSTTVIRELLDSDDQVAVDLKNYAFNNGMPLEIFIPPAGIVLRDEVMKELKF